LINQNITSLKHKLKRSSTVLLLSAVLVVIYSSQVAAQEFEAVGTRALGMGGAFVAVADDATAPYWNPAGLGTGATFSMVLDWAQGDPRVDGDLSLALAEGVVGKSGYIFATTTPAFGASYYRLTLAAVRPGSTALGADGRPVAIVDSLRTDNFGATFVQSILRGLVVGTTVRLVSGKTSSGLISAATTSDAFDDRSELSSHVSTDFDVDIGAMAAYGITRFGITARNLHQPDFEGALPTDPELRLSRQVRAGVAVTPGRPASAAGASTTLAFDADLERVENFAGSFRNVSVGAEQWLASHRIGVRGGLRLSTIGNRDPVGSIGFSAAVRQGTYFDGHLSRGGDEADTSWSVSFQLTF
jgi:hypothetical protein